MDKLYVMTCCYVVNQELNIQCGVEYEYRLYNKNGQKYIGKERPKGDYIQNVSHGLCLEHLVQTYKDNDIEMPEHVKKKVIGN